MTAIFTMIAYMRIVRKLPTNGTRFLHSNGTDTNTSPMFRERKEREVSHCATTPGRH